MSPARMFAGLASVTFVSATPSGTNLGFEDGLAGWTHSGVAIETTDVHEGTKALDLKGGFIQQTITGLTAGEIHTLSLAYQDTITSDVLSHASIKIDGLEIAQIHNNQSNNTQFGRENEFVSCNGFEFTPATSSALLRIETISNPSAGFRIDDIRVELGKLPPPPSAAWSSLTVMADARGARRLVNGDFEASLAPAAGDPCNAGPDYNPHVSGFSLPGWKVTQENVDVVQQDSVVTVPEGSHALDTGGHGPGGIAQTITGLVPGAVYTLSFYYARHIYWGTGDMTGEVLANGIVVSQLVRNSSQTWNSGYEIKEIPMLADASGSLTVEIRSTSPNQGGNIIYDDIRLSEGGDAFFAWTVANGIAYDPDGNPDGDPFTHEFEFLLNQNPTAFDQAIVPDLTGPQRVFSVPLNGAALLQGYTLDLEASSTLSAWSDPVSLGITLLDDTSAPGISGTRRYLLPPGLDKVFLRMVLTRP